MGITLGARDHWNPNYGPIEPGSEGPSIDACALLSLSGTTSKLCKDVHLMNRYREFLLIALLLSQLVFSVDLHCSAGARATPSTPLVDVEA